MKRRNLILSTIFLFLAAFAPLSGEESHHEESIKTFPRPPFPPPRHPGNRFMNYNGRKMLQGTGEFSVTGVKSSDLHDFIVLSVYFSDPVDTNSVFASNIFVNEKQIPMFTEFLFNKNHRMLRFSIRKEMIGLENDSFSLKIIDLRSFDGRPMTIFELPTLKTEEFFKKSESEETCLKS